MALLTVFHRLIICGCLGLCLAVPAQAAWNVTIVASGASSGGAWSGNTWTASASGAQVLASEIATHLGSGPTIISSGSTGSESGDLTVNGAITWSANSLTLSGDRHITLNANLSASGTATLALEYGQGAVAAGNTANYSLAKGAKVNLPAGANFSTKLGSDGGTTSWTVITGVGAAGDATVAPTPMTLQGIATALAGNYVLGADISASGTASWNGNQGFKPLGQQSTTMFTGKFDGLGHTISGLTIDLSSGNFLNYGMFGDANNAVLQNVGLVNVNIKGGANGVTGALAGAIRGSTAVRNCYVASGSVNTATQNVGGLVGATFNTSSVSYSYSSASVSADLGGSAGQASAGGLVGINNASISYSYATGSVSTATGSASGKYVGGLVGGQNSGSISQSYATGAVSGNNTLGGLVGNKSAGTISSSYWDKTTTGQSTSSGSNASSGLSTAEWSTLGPFGTSPSDGAWSSSDWGSGNPYPGVKALPTITITAQASQTAGSTASISIASIRDQNGADATSLVTTSGLVWETDTNANSSAGTAGTVRGKGAVAAGYQILYAGSFTVAAAPEPPRLVTVGSGGSATLTDTTPVTAMPGGTLVIPAGAKVEGVLITLAAAGNASSGTTEVGPLTFVIGGLKLTLNSYLPGTVVSFKKVSINGVDTLVLSVASGSLKLAAAAGQPLLTLNGSATLTTGDDGGAVSFLAQADGSAHIAVTQGSVLLSANAFAAVKNGRLQAGEIASFNAAGKISSVRLGSLAGDQPGDPLPMTGKPDNLSLGVSIPRLAGKIARLPDGLESMLAAALGGQGAQAASGSISVTGEVAYNFLPVGDIVIDDDQPDGWSRSADALVRWAKNGVVLTLVPAPRSLWQFAEDLARALPGARVELTPTGVLHASVAGQEYALRPVAQVSPAAGAAGLLSADGQFSYQDGQGGQQLLLPWFLELGAVQRLIEQTLPGATTTLNDDGSLAVRTASQTFTLAPVVSLTLPNADIVPRIFSGQTWWLGDDGRVYFHRGGKVQGTLVR